MDRTQLISNVRSNLAGLGRGSLGVPVLLLAMLAMMTLPIPPFLLDVLFTFNIALSIVVLLVCVYALRPLDFAVFPHDHQLRGGDQGRRADFKSRAGCHARQWPSTLTPA